MKIFISPLLYRQTNNEAKNKNLIFSAHPTKKVECKQKVIKIELIN